MNHPPRIIGVLHAPAFPGSPRNHLDLDAIIDFVLKDAAALASGGVEGLLLENFGDAPFYPRRVPPHTAAFMTAVGGEVRREVKLPLGVNVLRNDAETAIAIASAIGAAFMRVNVHTGVRVTDQGIIEGWAHETLRIRKLLGADPIAIFADADVKHSAPLAPRDLKIEVEELIYRGGAGAVIVTGAATGTPGALDDLRIAKNAAGAVPVYAGSGVDVANVSEILSIADGAIVGTFFKRDGVISNPVDAARVRALVEAASAAS